MTKQRELIYSIITESCEHMTAYDIYLKAKEIMPSIAVGTVYRNLDLMVKANQIRLIQVADDSNRYDKTLSNHDHAICTKCGRVIDVYNNDLKKLLERDENFQVLSYNLIIKCICKECSQK